MKRLLILCLLMVGCVVPPTIDTIPQNELEKVYPKQPIMEVSAVIPTTLINNVVVNEITHESAKITFTTTELSNSQISLIRGEYQVSQYVAGTNTKDHSLQLNGLTELTTYTVVIEVSGTTKDRSVVRFITSTDPNNNEQGADTGGGYYWIIPPPYVPIFITIWSANVNLKKE